MAPKELEAFIHDHGIIGQNEAVKAAAKEVEKETVKPVEDAVVEIVETAALDDLL